MSSTASTVSRAVNSLPPSVRIGFIGGGQMGTAMMLGMLRGESTPPTTPNFTDPSFPTTPPFRSSSSVPLKTDNIDNTHDMLIPGDRLSVSDPMQAQYEKLQKLYHGTGVYVTQENESVIQRSNVIVLAVKPHIAPKIVSDMQCDEEKLVISVAAGLSCGSLEKCNDRIRVIRVMPNTPCLVGSGASAYSLGKRATEDDAKIVESMLTAVGDVHQVPEASLNAVTGVSGSGPAYIFLTIEALADGGVAAGLPRDLAQKLAVQTVLGAAQMMKANPDKSPGQFKDGVASPGGTTITALRELERHGVRGAFIEAVCAAANKGHELQSKL